MLGLITCVGADNVRCWADNVRWAGVLPRRGHTAVHCLRHGANSATAYAYMALPAYAICATCLRRWRYLPTSIVLCVPYAAPDTGAASLRRY
eukprot:288538-Rhodomonas_salina.1